MIDRSRAWAGGADSKRTLFITHDVPFLKGVVQLQIDRCRWVPFLFSLNWCGCCCCCSWLLWLALGPHRRAHGRVELLLRAWECKCDGVESVQPGRSVSDSKQSERIRSASPLNPINIDRHRQSMHVPGCPPARSAAEGPQYCRCRFHPRPHRQSAAAASVALDRHCCH